MEDQLHRLYNGMIDALDTVSSIDDDQRWPMMWGDHHVVGRFVHPSNVNERWFEDALLCRQLADTASPMLAYQLFWPDQEGRFPWDEQCEAVCRRLQPLLFRFPDHDAS